MYIWSNTQVQWKWGRIDSWQFNKWEIIFIQGISIAQLIHNLISIPICSGYGEQEEKGQGLNHRDNNARDKYGTSILLPPWSWLRLCGGHRRWWPCLRRWKQGVWTSSLCQVWPSHRRSWSVVGTLGYTSKGRKWQPVMNTEINHASLLWQQISHSIKRNAWLGDWKNLKNVTFCEKNVVGIHISYYLTKIYGKMHNSFCLNPIKRSCTQQSVCLHQ